MQVKGTEAETSWLLMMMFKPQTAATPLHESHSHHVERLAARRWENTVLCAAQTGLLPSIRRLLACPIAQLVWGPQCQQPPGKERGNVTSDRSNTVRTQRPGTSLPSVRQHRSAKLGQSFGWFTFLWAVFFLSFISESDVSVPETQDWITVEEWVEGAKIL